MIAAIAAAAVLLRSVVFFIVVLPFLLILSLFSFVSSVLFYFPSFYFSFIISGAGSLLSFLRLCRSPFFGCFVVFFLLSSHQLDDIG